LQDALGLDTAPLRIECVDVSHVQGSDVVASLVVFEDGLARKSEYRRFAIREGADGGDVGSIAEVTRRRFLRYQQETASQSADEEPNVRGGIDPTTGRPRKFAYPPNLYVVDGGAPQVEAASDVLAELGITDVAVVGLAKRLEESGCPAIRTRPSCPAPARPCTMCKRSGTRRTGSPSRTTGSDGRSG